MTIEDFKVAAARVADAAHWRVQVHPVHYQESRLGPNNKLKPLISRSAVSLRGWNFPHVTNRQDEEEAYEGSCYISKCEFDHIAEVWRVCSNGQFVGSFQLRELDSEWSKRIRGYTGYINNEVTGVLEFGNQIYSITEFYEFAARFAREANYTEGIRVRLTLKNILGFGLGTADFNRNLSPIYICRDPEINFDDTFSFEDIVGAPHVIAFDKIKRFLDHFDAGGIRSDIIQQIQREFYSLRIGRDRVDLASLSWPD